MAAFKAPLVLAALARHAHTDRVVQGVSRAMVMAETGIVTAAAVDSHIHNLIAQGCLERLAPAHGPMLGRYRVTGRAWTARAPVSGKVHRAERPGGDEAAEPDEASTASGEFTSPDLKALGIRVATQLVPAHDGTGRSFPMSVPRLSFLEGRP